MLDISLVDNLKDSSSDCFDMHPQWLLETVIYQPKNPELSIPYHMTEGKMHGIEI